MTFAATESVSRQAERLEKIASDMMITIGGDAFLIEAQINNDESIALRVFQYSFAYAVRTRRTAGDVTTLDIPAARIVYWETTRRTPDKVTTRLVFPDKTTHDYEVDALKVLD